MTTQIPPKQELERKRITERKSLKTIGEEYNTSPPTIRRWLTHHNIVHRPSKAELEHNYLVEKKSTIVIGKEYGVSSQTAGVWLAKHSIPIRRRLIPPPPKEELIDAYEHNTSKELAKVYGCSAQTVSKWFREYDIKTSRKIAKNMTCRILMEHAHDLKDDPERLSTKFLQDLIGVECE